MATASGSGSWMAKGVHRYSWTLTATVTTGRAVVAPQLPDKTVGVRGTFGGATVTLQGSLSTGIATATGWFALNDSRGEGNALTFTATGDIKTVLENPILIRPKLSGTLATAGTTSLVVTVVSQSLRR